MPRKSTSLPQLAIVGVLAVAVVGAGAFFVMQGGSPKATPTPTAARTTAPPTVVVNVTPTPLPTTAVVVEGTPESSPLGTWLKFKAPDGTWSASFPGSTPPTKQSTAVAGGKTATYYFAMDASSAGVYAVYLMEMDQDMSVMGSTAALDFMDSYMRTYMKSALGGTVESSKQITLSGKPALEFVVDAMGAHVVLAITGSGKRLYMLMAAGQTGSVLYPEHFFATFALK